MRRMLLALLVLTILAPALAQEESETLSSGWLSGLEETLLDADGVEFLSLNPWHIDSWTPLPGSRIFHGFVEFGRVTLPPEQARPLVEALMRGIKRRAEVEASGCFSPRHGLSAGGYDLVICFACNQVEVYAGQRHLARMVTTDLALPLFTREVRRQDLSWQGWARGQTGDFEHANGARVRSDNEFVATLGAANSWVQLKHGPQLAPDRSPLDFGWDISPYESPTGQPRKFHYLQALRAADYLRQQVPTLQTKTDEERNTVYLDGPHQAVVKALDLASTIDRPDMVRTEVHLVAGDLDDVDFLLEITGGPENINDPEPKWKTVHLPAPIIKARQATYEVNGLLSRVTVGAIPRGSSVVVFQGIVPVKGGRDQVIFQALDRLTWGPRAGTAETGHD